VTGPSDPPPDPPPDPSPDPAGGTGRGRLIADCARCAALCCVGPAFRRSADFAIDKPAGRPCPNLDADSRCSIHAHLRDRGFAGCTAYDCFGAGQQVVQVTYGGELTWGPEVFATFDVVRQLHELLWYAEDALSRPAAAEVHPALRAARDTITALTATPAPTPAAPPDAAPTATGTATGTGTGTATGTSTDTGTGVSAIDPAAVRATVAPHLRRASVLVRRPARPGPRGRNLSGEVSPGRNPSRRNPSGRDLPGLDSSGRDLSGRDLSGQDLSGRDLRRRDLRAADLSMALLIGADLRGADLRSADLLAADLRGADLSGADLTDALYLTTMQAAGARGDTATRLPAGVPRPGHWRD
jgi:hypothetical protein